MMAILDAAYSGSFHNPFIDNDYHYDIVTDMPKHCQVLGTRAHVGNAVSHSHRKTRRTFSPNLQRKRYYVPSLGRTVTLTLTPKGMKTIDRQGIEAVAARLIESGEIGHLK
ncbi:50S ribosomal protein L28 [Bifidobacterium dentium]|uniref:50S ribosomal protein L28 n=1 Tax=Bifidobacterium dentium TaxID=1689 RepID=UPI003D08CBB5